MRRRVDVALGRLYLDTPDYRSGAQIKLRHRRAVPQRTPGARACPIGNNRVLELRRYKTSLREIEAPQHLAICGTHQHNVVRKIFCDKQLIAISALDDCETRGIR